MNQLPPHVSRKRKAYSKHSDIYSIATGIEDVDGALLTPKRALFTAITGVLSLQDEDRKRELLGDGAYQTAQEAIDNVANGNVEPFLDVVTEATFVPVALHEDVYVPRNGFEIGAIGDTRRVEMPRYRNEDKRATLERVLGHENKDSIQRRSDEHSARRLVAAMVRAKHFPATEEFRQGHYDTMDAKMFS